MTPGDFGKWLFDTANEQAEMYRKLNNLPDPDNEREGIKHGWNYPIGVRPAGISIEKWSAYRKGLNNLPVSEPAQQPKGGDAASTSTRLEKSTKIRLSTSDAAPNVQPAGAAPDRTGIISK